VAIRQASAANITWTGGNNNNFTTKSNWSSNASPTSTNVCIIPSDSPKLTAGTNLDIFSSGNAVASYATGAIEYTDAASPANDISLIFTNNTSAANPPLTNTVLTLNASAAIGSISNIILSNTTTNATTLSFTNTPSDGTITLGLGGATNNVVYLGSGDGIDIETNIANTAGNLTLVGNSTSSLLTLGGVDSYSGATAISSGTLLIAGSGAINSSSGITINGSNAKFVQTSSTAITPNISLTSGTLDGTSTINSTVTVAGNASNIVTAGNGGSGNLSITTLTFSGNGTIDLNPGQVISAGTLNFTSGSTVTLNSTSATWTNNTFYDLINYGSVTNLGNLTLATPGGLTARQSFSLDTGNHTGEIGIDISGVNPVWTGARGGAWDTSTFNWQVTSGNLTTPTQYINTAGKADNVVFDDTPMLAGGSGNTSIAIQSGGVAPTSVTFNNGNASYTLTDSDGSNGIGGSATVLVAGSGTVNFSGSNSYTGGTTISSGTLIVGTNGTLGNGTTTVNGGILKISSDAALGGASNTLSFGGGTLVANAALSLGRAITVNSGGGTFNTNGLASTTSGNTTISGTLSVSGGVNNSGNLSGSLALNGSVNFGSAGAFNIATNTTVILGQTSGSVVQGAGGVVNGNLVLAGNGVEYDFNDPTGGSNPFTGNGTISVSAANVLITNTSGGHLGGNVAVPIVLNSNDPTGASFHAGTLNSGSSYTPGSFVTTIGGATALVDAITISGGISGASDVNFANAAVGGGKGELILSGATSTYTGNTLINAGAGGTVQIGVDNALPVNTNVIVGTGASVATPILDLNGHTLTVGSLADGPNASSANFLTITSVANTGNSTFIVGGSANPANGFGGKITNGNGTLSLVRSGLGTLNLTGSSSYSGATTVSGGVLALSGSGQINSTSGISVNGSAAKFVQTSSVAVSPAVTLTQGTLDGTTTVNTATVTDGTGGIVSAGSGGAGTLTIGNLTFQGNASISLVGGSEFLSVGNLTTDSVNTSGIVTINLTNAGWTNGNYTLLTYASSAGQPVGNTTYALGAISHNSRQNPTLVFNSGSGTSGNVTLDISGDSPEWTGAINGSWDTTTQNWKTITGGNATAYINSPSPDAVLFNDVGLASGGNKTITISSGNVSPAAVTFNNSSNDYTLTGSNGVAGSTSLIKSGSGNLTIQNTNFYSGGTIISAGTIIASGDGALGNSTGPLTLAGGTLEAGTAITSARSITVNSTGGTFNTNGVASSTSGATTINGPFSVANSGSSSGSLSLTGNLTMGAAGTLGVAGNTTLILGQAAAATDTLIAASGGSAFAGNLVFTNGLHVNFDNGTFGGGGQIQVQGNNTVLTNSATAAGPGTVSNAISLNSTGILFTKGNVSASTYTPGTFVTNIGGTTSSNSTSPLVISGVISGNSDVNIGNSSTGGGTGSLTLGLIGTPGGTSGYETYTGTTTINNVGNITFAASNVLPTSTDVIVGTQAALGVATLNLNGFSQQFGSLSDGASVTGSAHTLTIINNGASPATLTIGDATTVSGNTTEPLKDGSSTLALVKTGTDTINLTGTHSAFSGGVTVNQGTLTASGAAALGNGTVIVNPTGSAGNSTDAATLTTNTSAIGNAAAAFTVNTNSSTAIGTINFTSGSPKIGSLSGNGSVVLAGNPTTLTIGSATNNLSSVFSGNISDNSTGNGSITKAGTGTLTLMGASSYGSGTTISAGTLLANNGSSNGSATGAGNISVKALATLGGNGVVTGALTLAAGTTSGSAGTLANGAILAAGANSTTPGTLTTGNQTWNGQANLVAKVATINGGAGGTPAAGSDYDQVIAGNITLSNTSSAPFNVQVNGVAGVTGFDAADPYINYDFKLATFTSFTGVTFATSGPTILATDGGITAPAVTSGDAGLFTLDTSSLATGAGTSTSTSSFALELIGGNGGSSGSLDLVYQSTPEPGTTLLVLGGAVPMLLSRRQRRASARDNA
jgi:fibronectin-binding autotransporter adhesin